MHRVALVTLGLAVLLASPALAGRFVAVQEVNAGVEPMAKAAAQCRIANQWNNRLKSLMNN